MGRRSRIPEEEWEGWKETIEKIYMTEQQTLKLLIEGMASTHGFITTEKEYRKRLKKWGFRKNNTQGGSNSTINPDSDHARTRAAQSLPPKHEPWLILTLRHHQHQPAPEFRWSDNLEPQLWKMQIAIDTIIMGSFGSESEKWTSDKIKLAAPSPVLDKSLKWQRLNSQCSAFVVLSGIELYAHLKPALEQLMQDADEINMAISPKAFLLQLVYMWRICLGLLNARLHLPRVKTANGQSTISLNPIVPTLVDKWGKQLVKKLGQHDPTCDIMSALIAIFKQSPEKLKMALKRGYYMTIRSLAGVVGCNHGIVLTMWSHYVKSVGQDDIFTADSEGDRMDEVFRHVRSHADQLYGPCSPEAISILHSYTEMMVIRTTAQVGNLNSYHPVSPRTSNPTRVEDFALEVRRRAESNLQASVSSDYDPVAVEAYAFSTSLLAKRLYRKTHRFFSLELLHEAIDLLWYGNNECLIWASMLSKDRVMLLGDNKNTGPENPEKDRMIDIRARLPITRPKCSRPFEWDTVSKKTTFRRVRRRAARDEMIDHLRAMLDNLKLS